MAQAGLLTNPLMPATGSAASSLNPLVGAPPPPAATGLDALQQSLADIATIGETVRQRVPIVAPQVAPQTGPSIAFSPSTKQFFVQGRTFSQDDAQSAIESEALLGQPGVAAPQGGDWVPVDQQSYAGYLAGIKNPSLGTLFTKGFGRGVDTTQLLAGRGLQLAGAEELGGNIVKQQVEDLRRTDPYSRRFSDVQSGNDAVEWFVANLGEQVPNILESVAVAGGGAIAGTFTGGPGVGTAAGALAGLAGKSAFKQAVLAAARKKVAGEVLNEAERKVLRSAGALVGATAATFTDSLRTGAADIYGELRDQGADPDDITAKMTALAGAFPYALAEMTTEGLLVGRAFGKIAAPRAMAAGTSLPRRGAELLRRSAVGGAIGGASEGGTELFQESLLLGLSDQDFSKPENIQRLIDSFAAGAAIGGPIGAVANLRGKKPANLLNPGQSSDNAAAAGGTPQLGGPGPIPLLTGPSTALGPATEQVEGTPYTPRTDISGLVSGQQPLMLPPPGAVLQVQGQPDFVVDEDGNIRQATPDDVVVGISDRGFVPATAPGTQGVLDVFPGSQTTARELRGMMEAPATAPTTLLQPEGVTGEVPAAAPTFDQGVLPFETGLAPRYMAQPQAPAGTLSDNTQLRELQNALGRRQTQEQQFAGVQPTVTPEVGALDQRLAESQPFLDVMGTEGRLLAEPQYGVTEEEARQAWLDTKSGRTRNWNQLSQNVRNQWVDALNGTYTVGDLKQIKRDLSSAESAARLNKSEPRTVVTGAITPTPVFKKEAPRAAKKPKASALAKGKQARTAGPVGAKPAARPAPTGARALKTQEPRQAPTVTVQDVKADPQYKPTMAALDAAVKDGTITGRDRMKLLVDLNKDGDFELVKDELASKRAAAAKKTAAKKTATKKATVDGISDWDRAHRNDRADTLFEGDVTSRVSRQNAVAKHGNRAAHGMAKAATLTQAFNDLVSILANGIDIGRGRKGLDTASIAAKVGEGSAVGTATGTAYFDGAFALVGRDGHSGRFTSADQIAGILVNDAVADTGVIEALRSMFPNLSVESYSNTGKLLSETKSSPKAAAKPAPKAAALKKGKPALTYDTVRQEVIDAADADIISQEQYDTLMAGLDRQTSTPDRIKAQLDYLIKGGTIKKVAPGEARGLREQEKEVVREQAPTETAEELSATDTDYRDLNKDVVAARDAKEIYPLQARVLQDMIAARKPLGEIRRALVGFTSANKSLTMKQQVNRRDFLAGLAATIVVASGIDSKAYAKIGSTTKMDLAKVIEGLSPTEAVIASLRWIMDNSNSAFERRIAAKLLKNGMGDTVLYIQPSGDVDLYGTTRLDSSGRSTVSIFTPQGLNVETVLHELIHAYVQQRWGKISAYLEENKRFLKDTTDRNDKLLAEFRELWRGLSNAIERDFPSVLESAEWTAALGSADELLSWVMTNPDIQAFMRTIDIKGNPVQTPKNSMWEAFKKWVMELLGMKYVPSELSALDRILGLGENIIDAGAAVRTGDFSIKLAKAVEEQNNDMLVNEQRVEKMINGMPSSLRDPVRTVTDTFGGLGARTVARFGLMNQLIDFAVSKGISTARKFARLSRERGAIVERQQAAFVKWAEDHATLPKKERGVGAGTVNGLIEAMTRQEAWGFTPDYFTGEDKGTKIKIDPDLEQWYQSLSLAGQKSVREAFRLNYNSLKQMQEAVVTATNTEYDALIAGTPDADAKKKLEEAKANSLTQFRTLLKIEPTRPYAPLTRYGDWVVVGRSQELLDAMEAGDFKTIGKLELDERHYFVDFADTRAEAAKMQREIQSTYGTGPDNAVFFLKNEAEDDMFGGRDMMYAFQRLNSLIEAQGLNPDLSRQLRQTATQLQLMAMAASSARKGELRRRNIASGDLDMVKAILSRGRASAHFVGAVYKNSEILDALRQMERETKARGEGREDRQAAYNGIVARYVDGLQGRVQNTLADTLTSYTSVWMLGFSPSYYIQQGLQNLMLTLPEMAARHGYGDSMRALRAGYGQVMKAWDGSRLTEQLDLDKVDAKYRALAMFLAESGELDVGINKEMGLITSDGDGFISNTFKRVMDRIRGLTRKIEAINRLSAGVAMYDLELSSTRGTPPTYDADAYRSYVKDFRKAHPDMSPLTERQFAAANAAMRLITDTHGNYSMENAPLFLRGTLGRVLGQFQKFRVMLAGLYVREFYNAFRDPSLSPEERRVARRALMFLSGHAAIVGGLIGSPAAAIFMLVYNMLSGDDEERGDLERDIRQAVGDDTLANLLLRGVPTLLGVDVSGTLGQGNLLSVAPYAELPSDRDTYAKYILSLTGPAIGGVGANAADAAALLSDGNYYKALEKLMPRGIGAASKSLREAVAGETTMRGDVLTQPIDLNAVEALWGTLGLAPISRVNRQFARNEFYKDQKFYQDRASDIKRAYTEASKDRDTNTMTALKLEWKGLQTARRARGFKVQPVLDLVKAPREQAKREKQTVGGIPFTTGTKGRAEQIATTAGTAR